MLAIPLMKSEPVGQFDITPLSTYLKNQRCYDEALLDTDLIRFQSLRVQVASITEPADTNHQLMLSYVSNLVALIPRISSTVLEQEIKQTFHWNDAFQATKKNSFMSFYYEMAAVIWNLGALESLRGGRLDRSTDEGIRMAAKSFQYAAGCFDYLLTSVLPSLPSTIVNQCPCFTAECLNMVKQLMLAQAQLCFYEKAVRDKKKDLMKSAIIAKLAAQVAIFYQQACSSTKAGSIVQILDISWFAITDYQSKSFQAAKEYWQAIASKELANTKGSGYGEEVARYIRAEQLVRQAMEVCRKFNLQSTLQAGADALLQAITANRTQALHDLNTVYMEAVTPDHGLQDVPPVAMVKAAPFHVSNDATGAGDDVMFQYILPREFIVVMRKFYDEVSSTHSRCQDQVLDATNLGRMTLSSVGLPASIEACKVSSTSGGSGMEVPESVWQRIREIQTTKGGVHLLRESYEQIVKASRRALQTVQTIQECLLDAEQKDDQFRVRYPSYPGQRMVEMNQEIRGNVAKFQHALSNAQANDEVLRLEIFSDAMSQLALSKDELNRLLHQSVQTAQHPTITVVAPGTVDLLDLLEEPVTATTTIPTSSSAALANGYTFQSPEMLTLEEKLHDLAGLFESRQQDLNRLKQLGTIDLSKELNISIGTANASDQIYQKYSQEVRALDTSIQSSVSQQDALIAEIVRLNEIFVRQREADPTLKAKNQVIQGLEQAVGKYTALQQQLTSGQTFYSNLQSQLTTLQQNADDNAYTAQWQRQEFEASTSTKATPPVAAVNTAHLANQFASSVHVSAVPAPTNASYSAYPSFTPAAASPATTIPTVSSTAYTPTVTSPVAPNSVPAISSPGQAPHANSPGYQYNQHSYSVLPTPPAPAYHQQQHPPQYHQQQPPQYHQQPAMNAYSPPPTPQMNNFPGAVVGQPAAGPPAGYNVYPGAAPTGANPAVAGAPARPPKPLTSQEMDAKISRVMEMGFPRDNVASALAAANWNEEAALNILLGIAPQPAPQSAGPGMHPSGAVPAVAAPTQQPGAANPANPSATPHKSSGMFNFTWGKKG